MKACVAALAVTVMLLGVSLAFGEQKKIRMLFQADETYSSNIVRSAIAIPAKAGRRGRVCASRESKMRHREPFSGY